MCFDLRVLTAEAVARRRFGQLLPARLLPLIEAPEEIDDYHLGTIKVRMTNPAPLLCRARSVWLTGMAQPGRGPLQRSSSRANF